MLATATPKEPACDYATGSTELAKLRGLIADDGFAATFQTMGRYRTALLQVASALAQSATSTAEPVVTDHSADVNKMVAEQTKPGRTSFKYRDGEIRDASGRQLMLLMASNCTKKFRDSVGRAVVGILNANEPHEPSLSRDPPRLP
ncbi:hypothetical protein [Ralstonia flatus]|uniref:Uncharacterized protein n=1 Tax=Ralstonia flatus TaxID=3058601 RepID=A0AAD2C5J3_9RALS|nr:hypothetical protein [Ralstonia sp. LMG 32965]MBN6211231.1 hypothetical protein [Ralstonia pickettii]CAJ0859934.1 hypothetical protein R77567_01410 [Ralstonia sp. LMG 32965]CAJ0867982.1 hypothetical protein R77564_01427 [Ralstonia sp. LMG 32965]